MAFFFEARLGGSTAYFVFHFVALSPVAVRLKRVVGLKNFGLVYNNDNGHIIVYRPPEHRHLC